MEKPFEKETELAEKLERLTELNALLNLDEHGSMDAVGIDEVTAENVEEEGEAVLERKGNVILEKKGLSYAREDETERKQESATRRPGLAAALTVPLPMTMAQRLAEKKEQARSTFAAASPSIPQRQALAAEL